MKREPINDEKFEEAYKKLDGLFFEFMDIRKKYKNEIEISYHSQLDTIESTLIELLEHMMDFI